MSHRAKHRRTNWVPERLAQAQTPPAKLKRAYAPVVLPVVAFLRGT